MFGQKWKKKKSREKFREKAKLITLRDVRVNHSIDVEFCRRSFQIAINELLPAQ